MTKSLIVSNYNSNLDWLKMVHDYKIFSNDIFIYNRGDGNKNWNHLGKNISSPNIGGNQYDVLKFIIENYDNLPDISIFVKGNIWSKPTFPDKVSSDKGNYYTTKERFINGLCVNSLFSLWVDKWLAVNDHRHLTYTSNKLLDNGILSQPINHCDFINNSNMESRYFGRVHDLWDWCFVNPPKSNSVEFIPACNMVVPKDNILKYSKQLYEKLFSLLYEPNSSYDPTCAESHLIERTFYYMWTTDLIEKN
tara:strand:+ start:82 stop:831 length:750 start_codon:yes stop_codon:yes gene_type:complete